MDSRKQIEVPGTLKDLTLADAVAVSDLHLLIWPQAYASIFGEERLQQLPREESRQTWHVRLQNPGYKGVGLWQEQRLMGFAGWGEVGPASAEIYHFYLHPELWGGGAASWFMHYLLQQLREKPFQKVVLWVLRYNVRAQRFYQKHGFTPTHREQQRYKWGLTLDEVQFSQGLF